MNMNGTFLQKIIDGWSKKSLNENSGISTLKKGRVYRYASGPEPVGAQTKTHHHRIGRSLA